MLYDIQILTSNTIIPSLVSFTKQLMTQKYNTYNKDIGVLFIYLGESINDREHQREYS